MATMDEIISKGDKVDDAIYRRLAQELDDAAAAIPDGTQRLGDIKHGARKAALKTSAQIAATLGKSGLAFKAGAKAFGMAKTVASFTPVGFLANIAMWIGTEMLFEHYRRNRENSQTVIALPLTYRGKELTAGINGHGGMIYGDAPGKFDRMRDATLFHDDGDAEFFGNFVIEWMNFFTQSGGDYSSSDTSQQLNEMAP